MIAFEGRKKLDGSQDQIPMLEDWNWQPNVKDVTQLSTKISSGASATGMTFRNTFSQQVDSGENY